MSRLYALCLSFVIVLLVTACEGLPMLDADSNSTSGVSLPLGANARTPEQTVRSFLDAWAQEDFDLMYDLLSPRSQAIYPLTSFIEQYENADTQMGFAGVTYDIGTIHRQGTSAAVTYTAVIDSSSFGQIEDPERTIRLVDEGDGWRVAWSPMDIINGMTSSVRLQYVPRFAPRANIYDRNGLPLVQENGRLWRIYVVEQDMQSEEACFNLLASLMMRPYNYFARLSINYLSDAVYYVGEMDDEVLRENRPALDAVCGLDREVQFFGSKVRSASGRNYYGHGTAAHITGYVGRVPSDALSYWEARGYRSTDLVGLAGVEFAMQDYLAGKPERYLRLIDPSGSTLRELGGETGSAPVPVQLTIDRGMQDHLARAFNDAWNNSVQDWASVATGGGGVVIDVNSGAIRAMFSYPTYDPRIFDPNSTYENAQDLITRATGGDPVLPVGSALSNRAFSEQYAPGSTFKIIATIAAADSNTWGQEQIYDCQLIWEGQSRFGDSLPFREDWRVVLEYDPAGRLYMHQALTASCNPFFWEVGALMYQQSPRLLHDYSLELGMGEATGVFGLQNEASGNIPVPRSVTEALNNSIGQGDTSVTALQMARMVAAVANDGTVYRPYIIKQIGGIDGAGVVETYEPTVERTLNYAPEVLQLTREGMCAVPTNEELGTSYSVFETAEYSSCGKTGTAQASIAPHSWYVAYAPADNPQIAVAVFVTNSREGSEVAAPIVRRFFDLHYNAFVEEFPEWWRTPYVPLDPPRGVAPTGDA